MLKISFDINDNLEEQYYSAIYDKNYEYLEKIFSIYTDTITDFINIDIIISSINELLHNYNICKNVIMCIDLILRYIYITPKNYYILVSNCNNKYIYNLLSENLGNSSFSHACRLGVLDKVKRNLLLSKLIPNKLENGLLLAIQNLRTNVVNYIINNTKFNSNYVCKKLIESICIYDTDNNHHIYIEYLNKLIQLPNTKSNWICEVISKLITLNNGYMKSLYKVWPSVSGITKLDITYNLIIYNNLEILYKWAPLIFTDDLLLRNNNILIFYVNIAQHYTIKNVPIIQFLIDNNIYDHKKILKNIMCDSLCNDNLCRIDLEWWNDKQRLYEKVINHTLIVKSAAKK